MNTEAVDFHRADEKVLLKLGMSFIDGSSNSI